MLLTLVLWMCIDNICQYETNGDSYDVGEVWFSLRI